MEQVTEAAKRLFVSIRPPQETVALLARYQRELQRHLHETCRAGEIGSAIRWTIREQLHITLLFLEAFPDLEISALEGRLLEVGRAIEPFKIGFKIPEFRPLRGQPRILWLSVGEGSEALASIHAALQRLRPSKEDPSQARPARPPGFRPHLTLGRIRKGASRGRLLGAARTASAGLPPQPGAPWIADRLELVQSVLSSHGPQHRVLQSILLGFGTMPAPENELHP